MFLTIFLLAFLADLVVVEIVLGINTTVLNPDYVVGSLDRAGAYQTFRDLALKSLTEGATDEYSKIMADAIAEAATPELLGKQVRAILPKLYSLVKNPQPQPTLVIDLTEFRSTFLASIERRATELGVPKSMIADVKANLSAEVPAQLDLVKAFGADTRALAEAAAYYRGYQTGLSAVLVLAVVLVILIVVLAGRRAWGPWLGVPLILGGLVLGGAMSIVQAVSAKALSDASLLGSSQGGFDPAPIINLLRGMVAGVWQVYLIISLVTVAVGTAVWMVAARLQPRPAPPGPSMAPPTAPTAPAPPPTT